MRDSEPDLRPVEINGHQFYAKALFHRFRDDGKADGGDAARGVTFSLIAGAVMWVLGGLLIVWLGSVVF